MQICACAWIYRWTKHLEIRTGSPGLRASGPSWAAGRGLRAAGPSGRRAAGPSQAAGRGPAFSKTRRLGGREKKKVTAKFFAEVALKEEKSIDAKQSKNQWKNVPK